jgi:hypothetical protein
MVQNEAPTSDHSELVGAMFALFVHARQGIVTSQARVSVLVAISLPESWSFVISRRLECRKLSKLECLWYESRRLPYVDLVTCFSGMFKQGILHYIRAAR